MLSWKCCTFKTLDLVLEDAKRGSANAIEYNEKTNAGEDKFCEFHPPRRVPGIPLNRIEEIMQLLESWESLE